MYKGLSGIGNQDDGEKAEVYKDCLHCGHCVAICPSEAVSIPEYDMEEVEAYDKDAFTLKAEPLSSCSKVPQKHPQFQAG